jgi:hypothetical protein
MPYRLTVNRLQSLGVSDRTSLALELDLLRAELNDLRTKYAVVLAKLDLDAGVTDTNYAALGGLAAAQFNPL